MLVSIKRVTKSYQKGGREVLNNIQIDIPRNKCVVITGPSGSGKSTLLAIMGGYLKASDGIVLFQGKDLCLLNDSELSSIHLKNIGYIPQNNYMLPGYTVIENIVLPYLISDKKTNVNDLSQKAMEGLGKLELKDLYNRYPYELSGGEQKRVSIIRATLNHPDILIADEPTSGLDKKTAKLIMDYLYAYSKKEQSVIVASHDDLVLEYGDELITLEHGKITEHEKYDKDKQRN